MYMLQIIIFFVVFKTLIIATKEILAYRKFLEAELVVKLIDQLS